MSETHVNSAPIPTPHQLETRPTIKKTIGLETPCAMSCQCLRSTPDGKGASSGCVCHSPT